METNTVKSWLREAVCGIQGHDNLPQFAKTRMYLKCTSCGHESAGWNLTAAAPKARFKSAAKVVRMPLTMVPRRVA